MSLPVEVLDYILSFLQSEVAILQACAQSHPILSKLVEQYLYANIILHDENRYPNNNFHGLQIVEFINLVSDSPHILIMSKTWQFVCGFMENSADC